MPVPKVSVSERVDCSPFFSYRWKQGSPPCFFYVNHVVLMLTSNEFSSIISTMKRHNKVNLVLTFTLKGSDTKPTTAKWSIQMSQRYFHDFTIFFAQFSVMTLHTSFQTHLIHVTRALLIHQLLKLASQT